MGSEQTPFERIGFRFRTLDREGPLYILHRFTLFDRIVASGDARGTLRANSNLPK